MDKMRKIVCAAGFIALCAALVLYLRVFAATGGAQEVILWQNATVISETGEETPFEMGEREEPYEPQVGEKYVFTAVLGDVSQDTYLAVNTSGAEITVAVDGTELFRSLSNSPYAAETMGLDLSHVPLTPDASGKTLVLTYEALPDGVPSIFPPILRLSSIWLEEAANIAYANSYSLPAGVFSLACLLVYGLFLMGLLNRKPDWSLPPMVFALAVLAVRQIAVGTGYYFLPENVYLFLCWDGFGAIAAVAMLAYLLMNRKRDFWRKLGQYSLFAGSALLVWYLISLMRGSYMARYVNDMVYYLFAYGLWVEPVYWLTLYLACVCALISTYGFIRGIAKMQVDAQALSLKNDLAMENCRAMEESAKRTSALRHELKNHITAMNAIYKQGDMDGLGRYLADLDKLQKGLAPAVYTDNFLCNAILQNAATRAAENEIRFEANVSVPKNLGVEERDLSSLLMNLIDNALEAAKLVEPASNRYIRFNAELKNGFLAVSCKNTYTGKLVLDERGDPVTSKRENAAHGFGIKQMRAVAEKYQSVLEISYTADVFTAQTALKTVAKE